MRKLLCLLGLHKWEFFGPDYESQLSLDLDVPEKQATRVCECCGKKQIAMVAFLNLYTGEKMRVWRTEK